VIPLSLVIVTFNSGDVIGSCLESFQDCTDVEIVIVDNASIDNTVQFIESHFPAVILIKNSINKGFASAANQGFARTSAPWVMFLNPDTTIPGNKINLLPGILRNQNQWSIAGCRMVDQLGKPRISCWKQRSLFTLFLESYLPYSASLPLISELPDAAQEVEMVSGGCMLIRRDVFSNLGGFDERFFMYYEDADLCLRARRAQHKIWYLPDIPVSHHVAISTEGDRGKFFQYIYSSKRAFYRKHFYGVRSSLASGFIFSGIVLRIIAYGVVGLFGAKEFRQLYSQHLHLLHGMKIG
jgi:N-acetylglucosaminyl-diphospho-decaprenol L-rhamnosyltransferase